MIYVFLPWSQAPAFDGSDLEVTLTAFAAVWFVSIFRTLCSGKLCPASLTLLHSFIPPHHLLPLRFSLSLMLFVSQKQHVTVTSLSEAYTGPNSALSLPEMGNSYLSKRSKTQWAADRGGLKQAHVGHWKGISDSMNGSQSWDQKRNFLKNSGHFGRQSARDPMHSCVVSLHDPNHRSLSAPLLPGATWWGGFRSWQFSEVRVPHAVLLIPYSQEQPWSPSSLQAVVPRFRNPQGSTTSYLGDIYLAHQAFPALVCSWMLVHTCQRCSYCCFGRRRRSVVSDSRNL